MPTVRPIPQSYYYSGQGRLGIGDRDPLTGIYSNVVYPGNVTSLTLDISTDKYEHKESMSGLRGVDLSFSKENKATFKFTAESLSLNVLALGLYGDVTSSAGGTVTNEIHKVKKGTAIPLLHPNVSDVVVTKVTGGGTALVDGTDYTYDSGFGTVYLPANSTLTDGDEVSVAYTYDDYQQVDVFTQATAPERYVRFEGLNTINGDLRLIEIPRAQFDPLTGLEMINEEIGSAEFNGSILLDPFITAKGASKFFRERRIYAADLAETA